MRTDILIFIIGKVLLCLNYIITNYILENYNIISCINNDKFFQVVKLICIMFLMLLIIIYVGIKIYTIVIPTYRIVYIESNYYYKIIITSIIQNISFTIFTIFYFYFKSEQCDKNNFVGPAVISLPFVFLFIMFEIIIIIYYRNNKIDIINKLYDV